MLQTAIPSKKLEYYLSLPYPIQLSHQIEDDDEYWFAEILDLPGCMADGANPNQAMENLEDAKRLWIETQIEDGYEVPEPTQTHEYSGKFLLRMPKSLHYRLSIQAKREGVSLNQYVISLLSDRGRTVSQLR